MDHEGDPRDPFPISRFSSHRSSGCYFSYVKRAADKSAGLFAAAAIK